MSEIQKYADDLWYFAYGSNLDTDRKQERTGIIREARKVILKDYKLVFAKTKIWKTDGKADIIKSANHKVYGIAYRIRPQYLKDMDDYEGVPNRYYRRINIILEDLETGQKLHGIAYDIVDKSLGFAKPTQDYLNLIINGLRSYGFEEEIIRNIKKEADSNG